MIRQQIGDKAGQDQVLNNIGEIYRLRGDYVAALNYLKQALDIQRQIGNIKGQGVTLNNMSLIYKALDDPEKAVDCLKQSLDIRQQIGDKAGLITTLFNIGVTYAENNQIQEAGDARVKAYILAKEINYAHALESLSQLAPMLGMPEGLDGWEMLAQHIENGKKLSFEKDDE